MTYITFTGWFSYAGCWAASLSSGIASIVGAPRILQVHQAPYFIKQTFTFRPLEKTTYTLESISLKRVITPITIPSEATSLSFSPPWDL